MRVKWKPPGGMSYIDLGSTLDNVVITPSYKKAEMKADQLGSTVINRKVSGVEVKLKTSLAEVIKKENWKIAFPHATFVEDSGDTAIQFDSNIGDDDISNAGELLLHPLSLPDADLSGDFLFYKAVAEAASEVTYGPEQQVKLNVTWNILPDFTTNPPRFFLLGDPAII
jgi:hypothetical protein